jgi:surfactin synthase thioesterase subunit
VSAGIRLFCLPHAGGGARAFPGWPAALPRSVLVEPVHLPGREDRATEPPEFDVAEVADLIAARIDGAYAVFGHSMGARLGFDVVRELLSRGLPAPRRLYLSAARPPRDGEQSAGLELLDDEELIGRITGLGGTSPLVFLTPELRETTLRVLRADLGWPDRHPYRPGPALPVPIVAFAAVDDPSLPATDMVGWQRHTQRWFRLHTLRGGHFFVTTALRTVAATIAADLLADPSLPAAAPTSIRLPEPDEVHLFVDDPDGTDPADDGALRRVLVRYGAAPGGTRATVHLELPGATCTPALPVPGARLRYETAGPAPR